MCGSASAQSQPPLTTDELKVISKALIDREEALKTLVEMRKLLALSDEQAALYKQIIETERANNLSLKKLHLQALRALAAYRVRRRSTILKILTFGIVKDKRDPALDREIKALEAEIEKSIATVR